MVQYTFLGQIFVQNASNDPETLFGTSISVKNTRELWVSIEMMLNHGSKTESNADPVQNRTNTVTNVQHTRGVQKVRGPTMKEHR